MGSGRARILIDPGQGEAAFLPVLARAMERCGCERIQEIVLTHGHPDHIGGVRSLLARFGRVRVRKLPSALFARALRRSRSRAPRGGRARGDRGRDAAWHPRSRSRAGPPQLRARRGARLFCGDNVLGVGTTVFPAVSGDLADYLRSLERLGS